MTDVLARRVRLLIESADSGASVAPEVAAIMAPLLGWNRRRRAAEVREYQAFAATNAAALRAPAAVIGDAPAKEQELVPAGRASAPGLGDARGGLVTFLQSGYKGYICHQQCREVRRTGRGRRDGACWWTLTPMWCSAAPSSGCSSGSPGPGAGR